MPLIATPEKKQAFLAYIEGQYERFLGFSRNHVTKRIKNNKLLRFVDKVELDAIASDILNDCIVTICNRLEPSLIKGTTETITIYRVYFSKSGSIKVDWSYPTSNGTEHHTHKFNLQLHHDCTSLIRKVESMVFEGDQKFERLVYIDYTGYVSYQGEDRFKYFIGEKIASQIFQEIEHYMLRDKCANPPLFTWNGLQEIFGPLNQYQGSNYGGYLQTSLQHASGKWAQNRAKQILNSDALDTTDSYTCNRWSDDEVRPFEADHVDVANEFFLEAISFVEENYSMQVATCFKLRFVKQLSYKAIGNMIDLNEATVSKRVRRVIDDLKSLTSYDKMKYNIEIDRYHGCFC